MARKPRSNKQPQGPQQKPPQGGFFLLNGLPARRHDTPFRWLSAAVRRDTGQIEDLSDRTDESGFLELVAALNPMAIRVGDFYAELYVESIQCRDGTKKQAFHTRRKGLALEEGGVQNGLAFCGQGAGAMRLMPEKLEDDGMKQATGLAPDMAFILLAL